MNNWRKFKIGSLVEIRRGASPRPIDNWLSNDGIPWVKISDATDIDSKYIYKTEKYIKKEGKNKSVEVFPEDLIISNSATPALPRIMKINACVHDGWLIPYNYKGVTRDFLYYAVKYYRKFLLNQGNGSIFKNLKTDILRDFEICVPVDDKGNPDLNQQKIITRPLILLDEMIESKIRLMKNNNKILETYYKYNFILFSNRKDLVYNEKLKKEIPIDWNVYKISDCVQHINTGLNPRDNFVFDSNEKNKYVTVKNLNENGYIDFNGCDFIDDNARKIIHDRSKIMKNDILFASIAPLGRCFLIDEEPNDWDINESVFSIRVNDSIVTPEYLYMYFKSDEFIKKSTNISTGSIFSGIRINTLLDIDILIPSEDDIKRFKKFSSNILESNRILNKEIIKLKDIREFLMPLLMSGQIKIEK